MTIKYKDPMLGTTFDMTTKARLVYKIEFWSDEGPCGEVVPSSWIEFPLDEHAARNMAMLARDLEYAARECVANGFGEISLDDVAGVGEQITALRFEKPMDTVTWNDPHVSRYWKARVEYQDAWISNRSVIFELTRNLTFTLMRSIYKYLASK